MSYDVIIAGAGPVGLCLALRLAREGKNVLVLEKNPTTHEHSRAPAIWPRTQEILADLGVIDTFVEQGIVLETLRLWDADAERALIEIPFSEVRGKTKFPQMLIIPQSRTEKLLVDALQEAEGAELKFSCELTGFTQDASSVTVQWSERGEERSATAQYLIGCDGAHSAVRKLLGFHLEGETYRMQAALSDIKLKTNKQSPILSSNGVMVVAIHIDTDLWRMILPHGKNDPTVLKERTVKAAEQLFPGQQYEEVWSSEFTLHNRISSDFVKGRIALAGDAAHLNSPVGGQGMNAGIQDTEVLGNALVRALEENDPARLEVYRHYRKEAVKGGVNRFTDILTDLLFLWNGKVFKYIIRTWGLCIKIPFIRRRFLRKITMIG